MPAHSSPRDNDRLSEFPIFLRVEDRFAVVIGNGEEALNKSRLLFESRITQHVVADNPSPELALWINASKLNHIWEEFSPSQLDGALLVFAATGEEAADTAIVQAARQRNIPVNAVDRPHLCDFYTPALINRAPIAVAIGSSGSGPVLTQILRARIETLLPPTIGSLARLAHLYRNAAEKLIPRGAARRQFWRKFFTGEIADATRRGDIPAARRLAARLLKTGGTTSGIVSLVGAGPGAEDLLTLRAVNALQQADVIVHDGLVSGKAIAMGRRDARRINVAKAKGRHSATQDEINTILVSEARKGNRVVRLKGGDPMVFGRAGEEIAALREHGLDVEVIPGVTSALAAAAAAQIPLTLRGVASTLVLATGHDRNGDVLPDWAGLALSGATIAVYMGRTVAASVAKQLIAAGLSEQAPVAIAEAVSTPAERIAKGTLATLCQLPAGRQGNQPALILIGEAIRHSSSHFISLSKLQGESLAATSAA
ncbi:MAG: siroheme synthase CysG [Nitratireductor sp.]